jgi:hypothetical protein
LRKPQGVSLQFIKCGLCRRHESLYLFLHGGVWRTDFPNQKLRFDIDPVLTICARFGLARLSSRNHSAERMYPMILQLSRINLGEMPSAPNVIFRVFERLISKIRQKQVSRLQGLPTGAALAWKMRPTTTPPASTSKSSSLQLPDGREADARLRINWPVMLCAGPQPFHQNPN